MWIKKIEPLACNEVEVSWASSLHVALKRSCEVLRRGRPFPQKVHHAFSYSRTSLSKPNDCPRICQWTAVMSTETPSKGRGRWVLSASLPLLCRVSCGSQPKFNDVLPFSLSRDALVFYFWFLLNPFPFVFPIVQSFVFSTLLPFSTYFLLSCPLPQATQ